MMNDLAPVPEEDGSGWRNEQWQWLSLVVRDRKDVRSLPGYKKRLHRVPDEVNPHTQAFVAKLGSPQIRADLDLVFKRIRYAFHFKRAELTTSEPERGTGVITTPFFEYRCSVVQDPDKEAQVIWQQQISSIREPSRLLTDEFASVFGEVFDTVAFSPPCPIDVGLVIDRIEELDDARVALDYDRLVTRCEIRMHGTNLRIKVTPDAFCIIHPQPALPRMLVQSMMEVQQALVSFSSL